MSTKAAAGSTPWRRTWAQIRQSIKEIAKNPFNIKQWIANKGPQEFCRQHAAVNRKLPPSRKTYNVGPDETPLSISLMDRLEDRKLTRSVPKEEGTVYLDDGLTELAIKFLIGDELSKQTKINYIMFDAVRKLRNIYEEADPDYNESERVWNKTPVNVETVSNSQPL